MTSGIQFSKRQNIFLLRKTNKQTKQSKESISLYVTYILSAGILLRVKSHLIKLIASRIDLALYEIGLLGQYSV